MANIYICVYSIVRDLDEAHLMGRSAELTRVYGIPGTILIRCTVTLEDAQHQCILLERWLIATSAAVAGQSVVGAAARAGTGTGAGRI